MFKLPANISDLSRRHIATKGKGVQYDVSPVGKSHGRVDVLVDVSRGSLHKHSHQSRFKSEQFFCDSSGDFSAKFARDSLQGRFHVTRGTPFLNANLWALIGVKLKRSVLEVNTNRSHFP